MKKILLAGLVAAASLSGAAFAQTAGTMGNSAMSSSAGGGTMGMAHDSMSPTKPAKPDSMKPATTATNTMAPATDSMAPMSSTTKQ
jgi:hypothetical protein